MVTENVNVENSIIQDVMLGTYEHYKGNKYKVLGVAKYCEDPNQEYVVYQQLYESKIRGTDEKLPVGTLWIRPKSNFMEMVNIEGKTISRFKKIG